MNVDSGSELSAGNRSPLSGLGKDFAKHGLVCNSDGTWQWRQTLQRSITIKICGVDFRVLNNQISREVPQTHGCPVETTDIRQCACSQTLPSARLLDQNRFRTLGRAQRKMPNETLAHCSRWLLVQCLCSWVLNFELSYGIWLSSRVVE